MGKTADQLRAELAALEGLEETVNTDLEVSRDAFTAALENIEEGTPEQLVELKAAFTNYTKAIRASWKYQGKPVLTEEQRAAGREAAARHKAKKEAEGKGGKKEKAAA